MECCRSGVRCVEGEWFELEEDEVWEGMARFGGGAEAIVTSWQ